MLSPMTQPPQSFYGPPQQPSYGPPPVAPPSVGWQLERVDAVGGTGFGLAQLRVVPITSGLAIGSLVAGIGAILVSTLALCFGISCGAAGAGIGLVGLLLGLVLQMS